MLNIHLLVSDWHMVLNMVLLSGLLIKLAISLVLKKSKGLSPSISRAHPCLSLFEIVCVLVLSCFSPLKHIARLQRAQHALARVVLQERSRARSAPLMQQLHWLPIEWLIRFKLATLTYKALQTGRPPYLADLIQFHITPKSTRSSFTQLLFVPRNNLSFGSRAFRVSAPKVWNTLPLHIMQSQSLSSPLSDVI